jgi:hypothetical protein
MIKLINCEISAWNEKVSVSVVILMAYVNEKDINKQRRKKEEKEREVSLYIQFTAVPSYSLEPARNLTLKCLFYTIKKNCLIG